MANPRHEAHQSSKKIAEEANRAANKMADAGERTARAGAAAVQRNAETAQHAWESSSEAAAEWTRRSTEQFTRAFGITGEEAEKAMRQSSRNLQAIAQSGSVFAQGAQEVSREYVDLMRKSAARNLDWLNALGRCRSPQELVAAQSEIVRDNMRDVLEATRRMAEASVRLTDEATQKMTGSIDAARREI
jgi:phasin family protein